MRSSVLIVDDHPSFRLTARALLESEGFEAVGEAADGAGAIEAARRAQGLADRVDALDGILTVDSPPGGGTRVRAAIPLPDDADDDVRMAAPVEAG